MYRVSLLGRKHTHMRVRTHARSPTHVHPELSTGLSKWPANMLVHHKWPWHRRSVPCVPRTYTNVNLIFCYFKSNTYRVYFMSLPMPIKQESITRCVTRLLKERDILYVVSTLYPTSNLTKGIRLRVDCQTFVHMWTYILWQMFDQIHKN